MIQINLLPENMKESSGPSSIGVIVLIFVGILLNIMVMGVFGWFHFVTLPDLKKTEDQLQSQLQSLKVRTKDYDKRKKQRDSLKKKTETVEKLINERILWSNRLQDIANFTDNRRVWFSKFEVEQITPSRSRRSKKKQKAPKPYSKIILEGFSAGRDLDVPNNYRKEVVLTGWWNTYFQEGGINDPAYEIKPLNQEFYKEDFYHTFTLELSLKPSEKEAEKKKLAKKGAKKSAGTR